MSPTSNSIEMAAPQAAISKTQNKSLAWEDLRAEKYEPLLFKIAESLGFNQCDSKGLVQEVSSRAHRLYADKDNHLPLRICLSKAMVRLCIFRISSLLFSQGTSYEEKMKPGYHNGYSDYKILNQLTLQEMPLSYMAVYVLSNLIRFNETEIAEILNTTPIISVALL